MPRCTTATGALRRLVTRAVVRAPGATWAGVKAALREGLRGLPGGTTLYRLVTELRRS
jgi:hypothetical protein